MRLTVFAILCVASLSLISCSGPAPKPPPLVECDLIAVTGGEPYLKCKWSYGSAEVWRVSIKNLPSRPEKYLCTDDKSYAKAWSYGEALDRWIARNCK